MAFPAVHLPDVLPRTVRDLFVETGGRVPNPELADQWAGRLMDAYAQIDPQGAATIRAMNPSTPAGLFNLGTILIPGAKGGRAGALPFARPTPGQASVLKAILNSSKGRRATGKKPLYQEDASTAILQAALGGPIGQRAAVGRTQRGSKQVQAARERGELTKMPADEVTPNDLTMYWAENPLMYLHRSGSLGPYNPGKAGPGVIPMDPGGVRHPKPPGGMDNPYLSGNIENYFPTNSPTSQAAATDLLVKILMGRWGPNPPGPGGPLIPGAN